MLNRKTSSRASVKGATMKMGENSIMGLLSLQVKGITNGVNVSPNELVTSAVETLELTFFLGVWWVAGVSGQIVVVADVQWGEVSQAGGWQRYHVTDRLGQTVAAFFQVLKQWIRREWSEELAWGWCHVMLGDLGWPCTGCREEHQQRRVATRQHFGQKWGVNDKLPEEQFLANRRRILFSLLGVFAIDQIIR